MLKQEMQGDNERSKLNYFIQFVLYYIASSSTYNTFNGEDVDEKCCSPLLDENLKWMAAISIGTPNKATSMNSRFDYRLT